MIDDDKFSDPGAEGLMLFELLASKVINDAHEVMHSGVKHTLAHSRSWCWNVHWKKLAEAVLKGCSGCKLERAKCMTPVISNLSGNRTKPSEPFESCQVDLCGPIKVMTPGCKTRKSEPDKPAWLSVFVCQYT